MRVRELPLDRELRANHGSLRRRHRQRLRFEDDSLFEPRFLTWRQRNFGRVSTECRALRLSDRQGTERRSVNADHQEEQHCERSHQYTW